ncbi:MAG: hypothetical protein ACRDGN_15090, partial [bacterium]
AGYWMRLAPKAVAPRPQVRASPADVHARLAAVLGCRWTWWAPDAGNAWRILLQAFDVGASHRVHVPVGVAPYLQDQARASGARLVEVDLNESGGTPIWPDPDTRPTGDRDVFVLDHRFGHPSPLPPDGGLVLEDATAAAGGSLGGRPVGSLGAAAVLALGEPPFARSKGTLVATDDPQCAERLRGVPVLAEPAPERAGDLSGDLGALDDWNEGCRAAAGVYTSVWRGLPDLPLRPVPASTDAVPTYSAYLIQVADPAALVSDLHRQGIEAERPCDARIEGLLGGADSRRLAGARAFFRGALRLPNHPDLDVHELLHAADAVRRFLQACGRV